jgi:hypothetical protein
MSFILIHVGTGLELINLNILLASLFFHRYEQMTADYISTRRCSLLLTTKLYSLGPLAFTATSVIFATVRGCGVTPLEKLMNDH